MVTFEQWRKEQESLKTLRAGVDRLCEDITKNRVRTREELEAGIRRLRALCEELFPDKLELFALIYESRFNRLWEQFREQENPPGQTTHGKG